MINQTLRVLTLALCLLTFVAPARAATITYEVLGGSADNLFASSVIVATQQEISWNGFMPCLLVFADPGPYVDRSGFQFPPSGIWSVVNNGYTTFTSTSGVVMFNGRTSTYGMTVLPGRPSNLPGFTFPADYSLLLRLVLS